MALVADTGPLYALYDSDDPHHAAVRTALEKEPDGIIVPVATLAEVDYLLRQYLGVDAELEFFEDLASGSYTLEPTIPEDLSRCQELITKYREHDIGFVDAAVVATADRLDVRRILTVDLRHFRLFRSPAGQPYVLLPGDVE